MQSVKREFFALRNGVIADVMRRAGSPFRIIFGLNLPQLVEIAGRFGPDAELARLLWENRSTRCSMLLAPMLMPREEVTEPDALRLVEESPDTEVIDVLCHRLLRHLDFASSIVPRLAASERDLSRYAALRLALNLLSTGTADPAALRPLAESEMSRAVALTYPVSRQLLDEISFLTDPDAVLSE